MSQSNNAICIWSFQVDPIKKRLAPWIPPLAVRVRYRADGLRTDRHLEVVPERERLAIEVV
jgi:hypothetical protein